MNYIKTNSGHEIPQIGLGVWECRGDETGQSISCAFEAGYRLIDTASYYHNEEEVGAAVRKSGVAREEILVTTKVWPADMTQERCETAIYKSLELLGLGHIDIFLLHWPIGEVAYCWEVLESLVAQGKILNIGVSNFMPVHLDELLKTAKIPPCLNQIESNPYNSQAEAVEYTKSLGIIPQAWGPLGKGRQLTDPVICRVAERVGKSPAQVVLRWHIQRGVVAIPKSITRERIFENINVFDFVLEDDDMKKISALDLGKTDRYYPESYDKARFGKLL